MPQAVPALRRAQLARHAAPQKRPRDTGFPAAVKLAVRRRAGNGNPDSALCECHGIFLGLYGGEVQHRVARGMGGRKSGAPSWFNTPANAVLMCIPGHRLAESRDEDMCAQGFWLHQGEDPRDVPIMLHSWQGGVLVWLGTDGEYHMAPPPGGIAA